MEIRISDPNKELDNMKRLLFDYHKAAKKRRGIDPYISMYGMDLGDVQLGVRNGVEDLYANHSTRYVSVMVHYPNGMPSYKTADNHSFIELRDALWLAEARAWENFGEYNHCARKELPRKLLHPSYAGSKRIVTADIVSFSDIETEKLVNFLTEVGDVMKKEDKSIIDSYATMNILTGNDLFCDSLETELIQEHSRFALTLNVNAFAEDMPLRRFYISDRIGGFGGYETLQRMKKEAFSTAKNLARKSVIFANAGSRYKNFKLTAGQYDAVIDGKTAGTAIHELGTGHMAEANNLLIDDESLASPFKGMLGKKIAIDELNIIDYGALKINGIKPFSYYNYDAQGVKAEETYIIKKGIFNSYLHTKETAGTLPKKDGGGNLTGNARLESARKIDEDGDTVDNNPEPRMSTLFIKPSGKRCSLENLLEKVAGKGIYISGKPSGYVSMKESQGIVRFSEVYFVDKNLELIPLRLKGCELIMSDDAIGFIRKIDAIGDNTTVKIDTGWCGSSSGIVAHSASGAAIKVNNLHIIPQLQENPFKKPLIKFP